MANPWQHHRFGRSICRQKESGSSCWQIPIACGLFGIRLLILHFKFQFTKSIKSSTFHISLSLTRSLSPGASIPHISLSQPLRVSFYF